MKLTSSQVASTLFRASGSAVSAAGLLLLASAGTARAQCNPQWYPTAGVSGATAYSVSAVVAWDPDGNGPKTQVLVLGGLFDSAGGVPASSIATWDGVTYAPLGAGITGEVDAAAVLPDGRLVVAGSISGAGGLPVSNVAVYDGHTWSTLGTGFNNVVWALAVSPTTGELYAGGMFTTAGGVAANRIARWNGTAWATVGTGTANGVGNIVYALSPLSNGDMIVGGNFTSAGGVANRRSVARWGGDGAWHNMGAGMNAAVLSLGTMSDDTVVAGGIFTFADVGPASRIAHWNGTNWLPMGNGTNAQPLGFLPLPNGQLIAGGHFVSAGTVLASKVAFWDGSAWSAMGAGMDNYVFTFARMPNGDVFAGGGFTTVEGLPSPCLARWSSPGPSLTTQPVSASGCAAAPVPLFVAAAGSSTFQWQVESPAGGGTFVDLTGSSFSEPASGLGFGVVGGSTDTLRISDIVLGGHAAAVALRCIVSNTCGSVNSDVATITVCYANCDCSTASPALTANDFQCFLNSYASGSVLANCDGSTATPVLTANDFQCFLNSYAAGCL